MLQHPLLDKAIDSLARAQAELERFRRDPQNESFKMAARETSKAALTDVRALFDTDITSPTVPKGMFGKSNMV